MVSLGPQAGNPEPETKAWAARLAEAERKREKYQEIFAIYAMSLNELRSRLDALEELRETARRELEALKNWSESLETLERDKERLLESYVTLAPEALEALDSEERRTVYSILGLYMKVLINKRSKVRGVFGEETLVLGKRKNVNKMMQQVQQMQEEMQKAQEELAKETVTASAGGGAVKATITGNLELVNLHIDPEVLDPDDVEMLQDMVLAAVNEALTSSQEMASKRLGGITGGLGDMGLNLPGM